MHQCPSRAKRYGILFLLLLLTQFENVQPKVRFKDGHFKTTDGVSLHYIEAGKGSSLVFLPGWTMPADIWERQIEYFSSQHHVIALDLRSQGRSEKVGYGHTPNRMARDLRELLQQLHISSVVFVGVVIGVPHFAQLHSYVW